MYTKAKEMVVQVVKWVTALLFGYPQPLSRHWNYGKATRSRSAFLENEPSILNAIRGGRKPWSTSAPSIKSFLPIGSSIVRKLMSDDSLPHLIIRFQV